MLKSIKNHFNAFLSVSETNFQKIIYYQFICQSVPYSKCKWTLKTSAFYLFNHWSDNIFSKDSWTSNLLPKHSHHDLLFSCIILNFRTTSWFILFSLPTNCDLVNEISCMTWMGNRRPLLFRINTALKNTVINDFKRKR